jgi:hypothetical protein
MVNVTLKMEAVGFPVSQTAWHHIPKGCDLCGCCCHGCIPFFLKLIHVFQCSLVLLPTPFQYPLILFVNIWLFLCLRKHILFGLGISSTEMWPPFFMILILNHMCQYSLFWTHFHRKFCHYYVSWLNSCLWCVLSSLHLINNHDLTFFMQI